MKYKNQLKIVFPQLFPLIWTLLPVAPLETAWLCLNVVESTNSTSNAH